MTLEKALRLLFLEPPFLGLIVVVGGSMWVAWLWFGELGVGIVGAFFLFGFEPILRWMARIVQQ